MQGTQTQRLTDSDRYWHYSDRADAIEEFLRPLQNCSQAGGRFTFDADAYGFATSLTSDALPNKNTFFYSAPDGRFAESRAMDSSTSNPAENSAGVTPEHGVTCYPLNGDSARSEGICFFAGSALKNVRANPSQSIGGSAAIGPCSLPFLESNMKSRIGFAALLIVVLGICIAGVCSMSGCTPAAQTNASNAINDAGQKAKQYGSDLTNAPTTNPITSTDATIRTGVLVTEAAAPVTTPYITAAGVTLTAIGTLLGALAGAVASPKATAMRNALVAVGGDVKAFTDPHGSFPAAVEKTISDVLGVAFAAPVPVTPTVSIPATPVVAVT